MTIDRVPYNRSLQVVGLAESEALSLRSVPPAW